MLLVLGRIPLILIVCGLIRTGDYAMKVVLNGAKTWTVTQEASEDDANWYACTDGNEGALGAVASTTTTAVSAWILPTLVPCKYIRFKAVNGTAGATTYSITLFVQEEA